MYKLTSAWKEFQPGQSPYVLPGDERILNETKLCCRFAGWDAFVASPDFGAPGNSQIHLDLLPLPFVGNLKTASVFLLMLNPGFGPNDYYGEYNVPEYRSALLDNLHQTRGNSFLFLDPQSHNLKVRGSNPLPATSITNEEPLTYVIGSFLVFPPKSAVLTL